MTDIYPFDREFRLKLLALCLQATWMARYGNFIIKPSYFERDDEVAFAKAVLEYRAKFSDMPDDPYDVIELMGGEYSTLALDIFEGLENWDLKLASDFAVTFAQQQAAKLAILDSVDDVQNGNMIAAIDRMKAALEVGQDLQSPGIDPIRDIDQWLYTYWTDKVPTRLTLVDSVLEGGLGVGEEGIILAPANRGKSMALINIGYGAATIGSGKNVVHFTHEMSQAQVAKRYAARLVFRFPAPNGNLEEYSEELVEAARKLLVGKIRIIGGASHMTTVDVENHLDRLMAENFDIGLIIDDYPDLLEPPRRYAERRFELTSLYTWLKTLGGKYGCPTWGASQANRDSLSKEIVTIANVAEDWGKAAIADVIVALCQTYEEEAMNQCRLFMAKVRDNPAHALIECKYYSAQMAIVTTGLVKGGVAKALKKGTETDV